MLSVIGNADRYRAIAFDAHPLVTLQIFDVGWDVAHWIASSESIRDTKHGTRDTTEKTGSDRVSRLVSRVSIHIAIFALPFLTNGYWTTRAGSSLPRISTCTLSPVAAGTRANPIERSSVGENVPLVSSPAPMFGTTTF